MQCTVFRQGEIRIFCQQFPCRLLHLLKQTGILCQVGDLEWGQAMLPLSEEVAGTPQLEVSLGNAEAVGGAAHDLHALAAVLGDMVGHEDAIALCTATSHTSP